MFSVLTWRHTDRWPFVAANDNRSKDDRRTKTYTSSKDRSVLSFVFLSIRFTSKTTSGNTRTLLWLTEWNTCKIGRRFLEKHENRVVRYSFYTPMSTRRPSRSRNQTSTLHTANKCVHPRTLSAGGVQHKWKKIKKPEFHL